MCPAGWCFTTYGHVLNEGAWDMHSRLTSGWILHWSSTCTNRHSHVWAEAAAQKYTKGCV